MSDQMFQGYDATLRLLHERAVECGVSPLIVSGAAVIFHGYERTTKDRDVLLSYREADKFGYHLEVHPDWERLEIRAYAFLCRPTGMSVDFLKGRDLADLGSPYYFPEPQELEQAGLIEGLPVIGLHDLLFFKLLAKRLRDQADIMELVKLHLPKIEPQRILKRLDPEDEERRQLFLKILADAPLELANERRLGQDKSLRNRPE